MDATKSCNPADLPLVTLDNNAVVAVRDSDSNAPAVNELLRLNRAGQIVINVTFSTALEAGPGGKYRDTQQYVLWLESLGILRRNIFTHSRTLGFVDPSDPGVISFDSGRETQEMMHLHHIMFPQIPFLWNESRDVRCARAGLPPMAMAEYELAQDPYYIPLTPRHPPQPPTPRYDALTPDEQTQIQDLYVRIKRKWHNAKNDSLGLYAHLTTAAETMHPEWSVFVTSDEDDFLKPTKLRQIRAMGFRSGILRPVEAVAFLRTVISDRGMALASE